MGLIKFQMRDKVYLKTRNFMPAEAIYQNAISRAFRWLQKQRINYPSCDSVWQLSKDWPMIREKILIALKHGTFNFRHSSMLTTKSGSRVTVAHAEDALIFKTLALLMQHRLYARGKGRNLFHLPGLD